jgi:hypothetical protein
MHVVLIVSGDLTHVPKGITTPMRVRTTTTTIPATPSMLTYYPRSAVGLCPVLLRSSSRLINAREVSWCYDAVYLVGVESRSLVRQISPSFFVA